MTTPGTHPFIRIEQTGEATVVHLGGDIHVGNAPELRQQLIGVLTNAQNRRLTINLSNVRYIDSTGVAALVEALKMSRDRDIELALTGVHGAVQQVLEQSRLNK